MLSIHHFDEGQGFGNSADNEAFEGVQYVAQFVTRTLIVTFAVIAFIVAIAFCKSESPTSRVVGKSKLDTDDTRNPVLNAFATADAAISNSNGATK